MLKTFKTMFHLFMKDINMRLLKMEIKRKEKSTYLDLWDKIELKNTMRLMESLEQQRRRSAI